VSVDPIIYEVIRSRLQGIVREMQIDTFRTGYSTLIRETYDLSCGLVDREGRVVAQFAGIPIHMGSYPECVSGLLRYYSYEEIEDGDCFFVSHPYESGSAHSLDSAVMVPIFYQGELVAFGIGITHKGDIGGLAPGSRAANARDLFGEGMLVPPVKYKSRYKVVKETENLIWANTRTPELLLGDYNSQAGPMWTVGAKRLVELMDRYGKDTVLEVFEEVGRKTEQHLRAEISRWKDGVYEAEAFLDNDLVDLETPVRIHVRITKDGSNLLLDFSESSDQNRGPLNVRPPIIQGSCLYAIVSMMESPPDNNHGVTNVIDYKFRPGSIMNPTYPAPVGFYANVLWIIEDMVIEALSKASGRPARANHGANGLFTIGSMGPTGRPIVHYELIAGGSGSYDGGDGWTGCGYGGTGPKITCVEVIETEFPVRIEQFRVIPDSGGAGRFRGGNAHFRDYRILTESRFSGGGSRYRVPPKGMLEGREGAVGYIVINPGQPNEQRHRNLVSNIQLNEGDLVRMATGSGAGVGNPKERGSAKVIQDVVDGYVTSESAKEVYGLSQDKVDEAVDWPVKTLG
jgi:N-methylhydantoinase B